MSLDAPALQKANKASLAAAAAQTTADQALSGLAAKVSNSAVGTANGVAALDSTGKVPAAQLPSYVDDVLEFADLASFPATGETGKIYVALDSNLVYRWTGSVYAVMSSSLALGETSTTAYRGDRGVIAYDHAQSTGNPHGVTKAHVGLPNVDNTSDADKPISTATQAALDAKASIAYVDNAVAGGGGGAFGGVSATFTLSPSGSVAVPAVGTASLFIDPSLRPQLKTETGDVIDISGVQSSPDDLLSVRDVAVTSGSGQVTLTWTADANGATDHSYQIFHAQVGARINPLGTPTLTVAASSNTATITGLTNGQTYNFVVRRVKVSQVATITGKPGAALSNFTINSADEAEGATGAVTVAYNAEPSATRHDLIYQQKTGSFTNPVIVEGTTAATISTAGIARYSANIAVTSAVRSSGVVTVITNAAHGLSAKGNFNLTGLNEASLKVYGGIVASVPNSTTFTFTQTGFPNLTGTGSGLVTTDLPYIWMVRAISGTVALNVAGITRSSGVGTITTNAPHGLVQGRIFTIAGANEASFNSNWVVLTVINANNFTFTCPGADQNATGTLSVTAATELSRSAIVEQPVVWKYYGKLYNPNSGDERLRYCNNNPSDANKPEAPRSPDHYKNPSSYNDFVFANTKYQPISTLDKTPYCTIQPNRSYAAIPVFADFTQSRAYSSIYYLASGETTPNQLARLGYSTIAVGVYTVDDNDHCFSENDGGARIDNLSYGNAIQTSAAYSIIDRNRSYTSGNTYQYDIASGLTASLMQTLFMAVNNDNGRGIKVWFDFVGQSVRWVRGSTTYSATFASLGITNITTSPVIQNGAYIVSDGINQCHLGGVGSNWVFDFNWYTNTVSARAATGFAGGVIQFNTEEDSFGTGLYTVNGRAFYITAQTDSVSQTWRMRGHIDNLDAGFSGIDHVMPIAGEGIGSTGIDAAFVVSYNASNVTNVNGYRVIFLDQGHDGSGSYATNSPDNGITYQDTNLVYLPLGNGVIS